MAGAGAIAQAVSGGYRGALGLREAVRRAFFGRSGVGLLVSPLWRLTLKRVRSGSFAPPFRRAKLRRAGFATKRDIVIVNTTWG